LPVWFDLGQQPFGPRQLRQAACRRRKPYLLIRQLLQNWIPKLAHGYHSFMIASLAKTGSYDRVSPKASNNQNSCCAIRALSLSSDLLR
jgi:hypothetical protein